MNPVSRVRAAYARVTEVDRPEVWITLRDREDVLTEATALEERLAAGASLPLAGLVVAVKDNIDVAGLPTTAGCPAFAYLPDTTATAVARLVDAGALVLGKTNLDQFATGLVGTRSPHGAVRNALDPAKVSGGSSSGSAVAVALGITDLGVGTDTAGSGRVPAAFNGLVGVKPTLGLVPTTGVVPACRSYDCVTVFATTLALAQTAVATMTGPDPADPRSRAWPTDVRLSAGPNPVVAVPRDEDLAPLSPDARRAFATVVERLKTAGASTVTVDVSDMLEAATLLYEGTLVAERHAAVGAFVDSHPDDVDPTVRTIIGAAAEHSARDHVADLERLDQHRSRAAHTLAGTVALLLPTAPEHPTRAEVAADPIGVNRRLGTYTNLVNLLDLAAVAVPGGVADGGPFGVSIVTRAFDDQVAFDVAALLTGEQADGPYPDTGTDLVVFGAHLRGQPLNPQLTALGARYSGDVRTAPEYRMVAVHGPPDKPGIVHTGPEGGAALPGERWVLSPAALGRFLAALPAPMSLGPITLADGDAALGFHCDHATALSCEDITHFGGWLHYLAR
ncbi:allophanate hydrolase [Umezawaea endophytica]|uniref:Allophanate hydrolase n=1 Tax=Umezawaea endophytica TaxID=1654476 RepID=A0A9X2VNC8_9PSEU|nr:allophanate hydrolase [Umezawaea endophytica]MCS7478418.1 allophanate hydrolase [Umezawaea endophytica]